MVTFRYRKGQVIGEGAYGKVYEGFDEDEGKVIAIKEIPLDKLTTKYLVVKILIIIE